MAVALLPQDEAEGDVAIEGSADRHLEPIVPLGAVSTCHRPSSPLPRHERGRFRWVEETQTSQDCCTSDGVAVMEGNRDLDSRPLGERKIGSPKPAEQCSSSRFRGIGR